MSPPPKLSSSTPRSGKLGSSSSRAISSRPIGSTPVVDAARSRARAGAGTPRRPPTRRPRTACTAREHAERWTGWPNVRAVGVEEPEPPVGQRARRRGRRAASAATAERWCPRWTQTCSAISSGTNTRTVRPRGRSRPSGSARAGAQAMPRTRASTGAPPARSAVTNTVCHEPVQRNVAAARATARVALGTWRRSRMPSPRAPARRASPGRRGGSRRRVSGSMPPTGRAAGWRRPAMSASLPRTMWARLSRPMLPAPPLPTR